MPRRLRNFVCANNTPTKINKKENRCLNDIYFLFALNYDPSHCHFGFFIMKFEIREIATPITIPASISLGK